MKKSIFGHFKAISSIFKHQIGQRSQNSTGAITFDLVQLTAFLDSKIEFKRIFLTRT